MDKETLRLKLEELKNRIQTGKPVSREDARLRLFARLLNASSRQEQNYR